MKTVADVLKTYKPWGGAVEVWEKIKDLGYEEDLIDMLTNLYPDMLPTHQQINWCLWQERELTMINLGIEENDR